jgi:hypothetical protein
MMSIEQLEKEINKIKERNKKVETDKAWEVSISRKITIAILTYLVIVAFFFFAKFNRPFVSAIVPTAGFVLSTLSLSYVKSAWIKHVLANRKG